MIQKGRSGGDQFETSAASDRRMNWWGTETDRRKDCGLRTDRAQGAHEHEAKELDLPLVDKDAHEASRFYAVVPCTLTDPLAAGGGEANRAFDAMMTMKIDIAAIEAARRG